MEINFTEKEWKKFYLLAAICSFAAMLVMLAEMVITTLPDGAPIISSMTDLFGLYDRNWFMGMRFMGLINIFATTLMIPVFFSLFGAHRKRNAVFAAFTLLVSLLSYAIFMSDNVAFPMLQLVHKYSLASAESEKTMLLSAAEALFARGATHTPGTFPGFFLGQIGGILFCFVIINGNVFKKRTGIVGLVAFTFLLTFEVIATFTYSLFNKAMILAMIGGTFALIWYILVGIEFLQLSKANVKQ